MGREAKNTGPKFPAISFKQPNADRVLSGGMRRDLRSRSTRFRGWILVHASKASGGDGHERGKILGMVRLEDCVREEDGWTYVWKSPRRFRTAIPHRGHYSIPFYVPAAILRGTAAERVTPGALRNATDLRGRK